MSRFRRQLIIFSRYPDPGTTKTRLIPALGPVGAACLQRRMTEHIVEQAREFAAHDSVGLAVAFEGGNRGLMEDWLGPGVTYSAQRQGPLGQRMADVFRHGFDDGADACVILGSDCPSVNSDYLGAAFEALCDRDVVIGPATDGGYVLLGIRAAAFGVSAACLFEGIPWGTDRVLKRTREALKHTSLKVAMLDQRWDVDTPEDLGRLADDWGDNSLTEPAPPISVIIPTKNEENHLASTLRSVSTGANIQVIVSDGQSDDGTIDVARRAGVTVLEGGTGRAMQLNAGARATDHPLLLFLHADTSVPLGYDSRIRRAALARDHVVGAFRLRIDEHGPSLRLIERAANWRAAMRSMPYGDQGLFMTRDVFDGLGGFPELPIMDDYEFMRRARRRYSPILLPVPVTTSARRWRKKGPWRTFFINQLMVSAYLLGTSPDRLAAWYRT